MERLTTNKSTKEMGMLELAYNSCYAKNNEARYRDYDCDVTAREFAKQLLKDHNCDLDITYESNEAFDEWMVDYLYYPDTTEGLIALLYRNLWVQADLRERLKEYEDAEEQGLLLRLPCKIGDSVYSPTRDFISKYTICSIEKYKEGFFFNWRCEAGIYIKVSGFTDYDIGETVFLTREAAEQALKEMESEG